MNASTSSIAALIFDLDGVLVNTVGLHAQAWAHLAARHGIAFNESDMPRLRGRQRRDCLLDLFAGQPLTEAEISAYLEIKDRYYLDLLAAAAPDDLLVAGAADLIAATRAQGLKLGVASSSANAIAVLHFVGLYDLLDAVGDGLTVARSKPAPDIFIWTAGALGVSPARCLVFEDSRAGITGARRAGMFAVGIGAPDFTDQAHRIVPDLATVTLSEILAVTAAARDQQSDLIAYEMLVRSDDVRS